MKKQVDRKDVLKAFGADFKRKLLRQIDIQKKEEKEEKEWHSQTAKAERSHNEIIGRAKRTLQWLASSDKDFRVYILKLFSLAGKGGNCSIILFREKHGKHSESSGGSDYGGLAGCGNMPSGGDNVSRRVDNIYEIALYKGFELEINENYSYPIPHYLFPYPNSDYAVPAAIRTKMLKVLKKLSNPASALKFFNANHKTILKLNGLGKEK